MGQRQLKGSAPLRIRSTVDNEPENKKRAQTAVIRQLKLVIYMVVQVCFLLLLDTFAFSRDGTAYSWHSTVYENISKQ